MALQPPFVVVHDPECVRHVLTQVNIFFDVLGSINAEFVWALFLGGGVYVCVVR